MNSFLYAVSVPQRLTRDRRSIEAGLQPAVFFVQPIPRALPQARDDIGALPRFFRFFDPHDANALRR